MSVLGRVWKGFVPDVVLPLGPQELDGFREKRVLITGAGGYLGSALARALSTQSIRRLVLIDTAEHGLYKLEQRLRRTAAATNAVYVVGSVCDRALMQELFATHAPQIVLHAAALKHVPLMESNPLAAAETNALGTELMVKAAKRHGAESFVLLSTDKAVGPISVMGATKRIAEQLVMSQYLQTNGSAFRAVRLCNVLGSTGSVAPLFSRQVALGGPVTVTHPEATRFFLSRLDAVNLLLRAALVRSRTGLMVPVVGLPRSVLDLAEYAIAASCRKCEIEVRYTGLREADKLNEQLVHAEETVEAAADLPGLLNVQSEFSEEELFGAMAEVRAAVFQRDRVRLIRAIQRAVPGYVKA